VRSGRVALVVHQVVAVDDFDARVDELGAQPDHPVVGLALEDRTSSLEDCLPLFFGGETVRRRLGYTRGHLLFEAADARREELEYRGITIFLSDSLYTSGRLAGSG